MRSSGRPESLLSDRDFDHRGGSNVGGGDDAGGEEGFFEIPDGFPSLMTLGAGFESMKIRRDLQKNLYLSMRDEVQFDEVKRGAIHPT